MCPPKPPALYHPQRHHLSQPPALMYATRYLPFLQLGLKHLKVPQRLLGQNVLTRTPTEILSSAIDEGCDGEMFLYNISDNSFECRRLLLDYLLWEACYPSRGRAATCR